MSEQATFAAHLEAHRGIVRKVAAMYAWNDEDRRDLAQEIQLQLWRAYGSYDPTRAFSTWMYRVALNVAISTLRRQRESVPLDDAIPAPTSERDDRSAALHAAIASLGPVDRALALMHLDDHSNADLAEVTGLRAGTVAVRLTRIRARLRELMTKGESR